VTRFIIRRLLLSIPVLFGIVFVVFTTARLIPGDPCRAVLGERATDAVCEQFTIRYGLDKAILPGLFRVKADLVFDAARVVPTIGDNQFLGYLGDVSRGDLGQSIKQSRPVTTMLVERLPTTI